MDDIKEIDESSMNIPKKKNVFFLVILSLITIFIYPFIWYIKRSEEFNNLQTRAKLRKLSVVISLVLYLLTIFSIIGMVIIAKMSDIGTEINFSNLPIQFIILFFISVSLIILDILLFLFMAFKSRKILNQALENKGIQRKVSGFFTFFFNFFYLQYEINKIIDDKEMEKRIWPIIFFILL
ncbi:MAG: DUF4234 domain-containing protein, partial [Candidatus Pacearchaeota archaeon]